MLGPHTGRKSGFGAKQRDYRVDSSKTATVSHFISHPTSHLQYLVSELLEDVPWIDSFLAESGRRLRTAYEGLAGALRAARIPFVEADSAMFCWVDMREALVARRCGGRMGEVQGAHAGGAGDTQVGVGRAHVCGSQVCV